MSGGLRCVDCGAPATHLRIRFETSVISTHRLNIDQIGHAILEGELDLAIDQDPVCEDHRSRKEEPMIGEREPRAEDRTSCRGCEHLGEVELGDTTYPVCKSDAFETGTERERLLGPKLEPMFWCPFKIRTRSA